jgi:hypothetical protein
MGLLFNHAELEAELNVPKISPLAPNSGLTGSITGSQGVGSLGSLLGGQEPSTNPGGEPNGFVHIIDFFACFLHPECLLACHCLSPRGSISGPSGGPQGPVGNLPAVGSVVGGQGLSGTVNG